MNASRHAHNPTFIVRGPHTDWVFLQARMLMDGVLPVRCDLANLPRRLHELKAIRLLSPQGTKIELVIDQDIENSADLSDLGRFLVERHFAGMTLDPEISIGILGGSRGIENLARNFAGTRRAQEILRTEHEL